MKLHILTGTLVLSLLTVVNSAVAQDASSSATSKTKIDDPVTDDSADNRRVPISINPQIGLTSLSYTGRGASGTARSELSGGVTAEFGEPSRRLETGALILRNNTQADNQPIRSSFLALPMLAKIRVMSYKSQSWFVKAGAMTMFELNSSNNKATNNLDVMGTFGVGGRFAFTRKADLVVDATYNRGMLSAIRSNLVGSTYNQGFLVMAGLSFNL